MGLFRGCPSIVRHGDDMRKFILFLVVLWLMAAPARADWFSTPVNGDNTTIEKSAGKLRVKDGGISAAKLATNSVTTIKIDDLAVTTGKLADQAATANKVADIVGADVSRSLATSYLATTDGEFCGTLNQGTDGSGTDLIGFTDSSDPPTTVKGYASGWRVDSTFSGTYGNRKDSWCFLVKSGNYYMATEDHFGTVATITLTFTPLGS